jgi:putative ABC transport system permease protein
MQGFSVNEVSASLSLKNPDMFDDFEREVRAKGLPDYYRVRSDDSQYKAIVSPMENMTGLTTAFLVVTLVLGGIVLLIVTVLGVRERKYEIGVLRAMGMKKAKVALGFFFETLIITVLCLGIGFGVSTALARPVSAGLLSNQIAAAEEQRQNGPQSSTISSGSFAGNSDDDESTPLSTLDVGLSGVAIAEIAGIALLLALVSSAAGIVYVTRYEPMKILQERN